MAGKTRRGETNRREKIVKFNTQAEEIQEATPKKRRKKPWWILLLLLVLALGAGGYVLWRYMPLGTYNSVEVLESVENTGSTQMNYRPYLDGMIRYGQEGISYINRAGEVVWMESYKMKQPTISISDTYVLVADLNGNAVYIFNEKGRVSEVQAPYSICKADVASQGVYALVMENETENYVQLFDKYGSAIVEMRTTVADSGYPFDIALSADGTKLATSYLTVEGIAPKNTIAMYNFDSVGQNETDRLVGGFNDLGDTLVPKIEFLDNNTICAFGDNKFIFYTMRQKPSQKAVIESFDGDIKSILYNSHYVGVVENGSTGEGEADSLYTLRVFDTYGNERFRQPIAFNYRDIYATESEIMIIGSSEVEILDFSGREILRYSFPREIKNIVPTGTPRKYVVVYDDVTEVVKLTHEDEETAE